MTCDAATPCPFGWTDLDLAPLIETGELLVLLIAVTLGIVSGYLLSRSGA